MQKIKLWLLKALLESMPGLVSLPEPTPAPVRLQIPDAVRSAVKAVLGKYPNHTSIPTKESKFDDLYVIVAKDTVGPINFPTSKVVVLQPSGYGEVFEFYLVCLARETFLYNTAILDRAVKGRLVKLYSDIHGVRPYELSVTTELAAIKVVEPIFKEMDAVGPTVRFMADERAYAINRSRLFTTPKE